MWPEQVSNPGPLALESDALLTALRSPALTPIEKGGKHENGRVASPEVVQFSLKRRHPDTEEFVSYMTEEPGNSVG